MEKVKEGGKGSKTWLLHQVFLKTSPSLHAFKFAACELCLCLCEAREMFGNVSIVHKHITDPISNARMLALMLVGTL